MNVIHALLVAGASLHSAPFLVDRALANSNNSGRKEALDFLLYHNYSFEPSNNTFTPLMNIAKDQLFDELEMFLSIPAIQKTIDYTFNGYTGIFLKSEVFK